MLLFVGLAIVAGIAFRLMTIGERQRLLERSLSILRVIIGVARRRHPELDSFRAALRNRTPIAIVTPVILVSSLAIFALMRSGAGAPGDPGPLFWASSFGPSTTNGEWWRLATSMLVHQTTFLLVVNAVALVTVAPLIERYVGTVAFVAVFLMSGLMAGAVNLWWYPVAVSAGASGPIFGTYGLLLSASLWNRFHRQPDPEPDDAPTAPTTVVIPARAIARTAPAAVTFVTCSMLSDDLAIAAQLAAFGVGFAGGLLMTRRASQQKPSIPQAGRMAIAAGAMLLVIAVPVRGIADVKPEIERVVALEARTASAYRVTYERFRRGKATADTLAQQIDSAIVPDLQAAEKHLQTIERVPHEHQRLVTDAEEYLRLRIESWRLRARALRMSGRIPERDASASGVSEDAAWRVRAEQQYRSHMAASGSAEGAERASHEALQRIRTTSVGAP